jgi:hypothetical protein
VDGSWPPKHRVALAVCGFEINVADIIMSIARQFLMNSVGILQRYSVRKPACACLYVAQYWLGPDVPARAYVTAPLHHASAKQVIMVTARPVIGQLRVYNQQAVYSLADDDSSAPPVSSGTSRVAPNTCTASSASVHTTSTQRAHDCSVLQLHRRHRQPRKPALDAAAHSRLEHVCFQL